MTTTTNVPETMTRQATVAEASQVAGRNGETQWALKLIIPDISKFPTPCFLALEQASQVLKGSTHLVTMRRGKTKQGKEGKYASEYFWDLTGWDVQAPPPQAPAAQAPSATQRPQEGPPATETPVTLYIGGIGHESDWAGPLYHDVTEAAYNARINWAQAINLAMETTGGYFAFHDLLKIEAPDDEMPPRQAYLQELEGWANRFYSLIRKGPTTRVPDCLVDPETLPWDAPQTHQDDADGLFGPEDAPAPVPGSGKALPPFPVRGEKEAPVAYYLRVAQARYGKTQKAALAVIGGTWSGWVNAAEPRTGEDALQRGLKKLEAQP